jgi:hypothetical protein
MTTYQPESKPRREPAAGSTTVPAASHLNGADIIPVGEEPKRRLLPVESGKPHQSLGGGAGGHAHETAKKPSRSPIRNQERFRAYKNALHEVRVFRRETMRHLRRAEICAWLAIHDCQGADGACISQRKIGEFAGIKGNRHVVNVIKALRQKGLLEVLVQGRYRPNGPDHGIASVYRVYPRPEPRLVEVPLNGEAARTKGSTSGSAPSSIAAESMPAGKR